MKTDKKEQCLLTHRMVIVKDNTERNTVEPLLKHSDTSATTLTMQLTCEAGAFRGHQCRIVSIATWQQYSVILGHTAQELTQSKSRTFPLENWSRVLTAVHLLLFCTQIRSLAVASIMSQVI